MAAVLIWMIPVTNNNHNHYGKEKISYGLVENEYEDWLAINPGLIDGGKGGDDDQQVQGDLRDELQYWNKQKTISYWAYK